MKTPVATITKCLEKVTASGQNSSAVFDDWLDVVHLSLQALPRHLRAARSGQPLQDTPEVEQVFQRLHARYSHRDYWANFSAAFAALLESTDEWQDVIGQVYMDFGIPNKYSGQFFTPWSIARCMAEMTMQDIEERLHQRIKAAIEKDVFAQAVLITGQLCHDPQEAADWFFNRVLPAAAPFVDPITVSDCCCGSGVMLLAAASCTPRWALDYGLVQFYGTDIDVTCVKMATVNLMLYGLNGFHLKCALELSQAELAALPQPHAEAYVEAQLARQENDDQRFEQIALDLRQYRQTSLFELVSP